MSDRAPLGERFPRLNDVVASGDYVLDPDPGRGSPEPPVGRRRGGRGSGGAAERRALKAERNPISRPAALEEPRVIAWQDLLSAQRRWLLAGRPGGSPPEGPELSQKPIPTRELQSLVYRYTRHDQYNTDGMGYGEVVVDELRAYTPNGQTLAWTRRSQRTATGRQTLNEPDPARDRAPADAATRRDPGSTEPQT